MSTIGMHSYEVYFLSNIDIVILRYTISKCWKIETQRSAENGVDSYNRIEVD